MDITYKYDWHHYKFYAIGDLVRVRVARERFSGGVPEPYVCIKPSLGEIPNETPECWIHSSNLKGYHVYGRGGEKESRIYKIK